MLQLRIIGIEESRENEALKKNLQMAMAYFKVEFLLQEVKEVDEIMQEDIQGIPALFINEELVFQKQVPSVEDIVRAIKLQLQKRDKKWLVKRILVPTDFSDASLNGFTFAQHLAKRFGAEVKLLHCFHSGTDANYPFAKEEKKDFQIIARERLRKFEEKGRLKSEENGIATLDKVETEAISGFATEEIVKASKEPDIDMVVMATTGSHGMLGKFFGTVSTAVAKNAGCPVLLVPPNVRYRPFENILYASNHESADTGAIENLMLFAGQFEGNLHFVHIERKSTRGVNVADVVFDGTMGKIESQPNIIFDTIQASSIAQGLNQYSEKNDVDLIVMVTRYRNIVDSWLHRSKTKQMIMDVERPLLVLHHDQL
jgi:nucleotide-binding universal stress UspA family protein